MNEISDNGLGSVLLVSTDEAITQDVEHALKVVGIPLLVAHSLAEATELIAANQPALVLTRPAVDGRARGGILLAEAIRKAAAAQRPPVVGLVTSEERALLGDEGDVFTGEILLPVVFPVFGQRIRRLLSEIAATL